MACDIDDIDILNCQALYCFGPCSDNPSAIAFRNRWHVRFQRPYDRMIIRPNRCNRRLVPRSVVVVTMMEVQLWWFLCCRCHLLSWVAVAVGMQWSLWSSVCCPWFLLPLPHCGLSFLLLLLLCVFFRPCHHRSTTRCTTTTKKKKATHHHHPTNEEREASGRVERRCVMGLVNGRLKNNGTSFFFLVFSASSWRTFCRWPPKLEIYALQNT